MVLHRRIVLEGSLTLILSFQRGGVAQAEGEWRSAAPIGIFLPARNQLLSLPNSLFIYFAVYLLFEVVTSRSLHHLLYAERESTELR